MDRFLDSLLLSAAILSGGAAAITSIKEQYLMTALLIFGTFFFSYLFMIFSYDDYVKTGQGVTK